MAREARTLVALAYVRAHLLMTEAELADVRLDIAECAKSTGVTLETVHVEQPDRTPFAFQALVNELVDRGRTGGPVAVIVPGIHHLAGLGSSPTEVLSHFNRTLGARVLVARHHP